MTDQFPTPPAPTWLDVDELPADRVRALAMWLCENNIGILDESDDGDLVCTDLDSMTALAQRLLQHGPDGIRITPVAGELVEIVHELLRQPQTQHALASASGTRQLAEQIARPVQTAIDLAATVNTVTTLLDRNPANRAGGDRRE
ncbi:hypothetical protein [Crossiella sp. CA198]|uniref:hypothetical protein n=1 Tax=Crossiella sp. CA198 TaxID=3455607 RepID=UPI003F8D45F1